MAEIISYLRELNIASVALRLALAMLLGGMIGMERGRKRRAAGFRTYLLVCMGAALTMLLGQYFTEMFASEWAAFKTSLGIGTDAARMGAQVINGIGFLGAGTIIVTGRQEVKGLTTAAGLWASACMGLAVGAGFYECVILAFLLIFLSIRVLLLLEVFIVENTRSMNIYVEFDSMENIGGIIAQVKRQEVRILDVEIDRGSEQSKFRPSANFVIRLRRRMNHAELLAAISGAEGIRAIEEL